MLLLYQVANQWNPAGEVAPPAEAVVVGGSLRKRRRGGLLHELAWLARMAEAAQRDQLPEERVATEQRARTKRRRAASVERAFDDEEEMLVLYLTGWL